MADRLTGGARALLGQGLGMGWGDEAEAWLRSKLGQGDYEDLVKGIRSEYGQYAEENPIASSALEFTGGVAPGVAAAFLPGGQPAAAAQGIRTAGALSRLASSPLARATAAGAVSGGVTGAGTAEEGSRASGAATGTVLGTVLGLGTPVGLRASKSAYDWLRERVAPSEKFIERSAVRKMLDAMRDTGVSPKDIEARVRADRGLGVPSMIANTDPALVGLAEAVAQRGRKGAMQLEEAVGKQKSGSRQRVYQQVEKGLSPGDYFADEQKFVGSLRSNANNAYDKAYAVGEVDDPQINAILTNPVFAKFYDKARSIAETEALAAKIAGKDPSKYQLRQVYKPIYETDPATGSPILKGFDLQEPPDVRTLDYIKRGIDATIDAGMRGGGLSSSEANALKELRNSFRDRLDILVPEYKTARQMYGGDMEVLDALRMGMKDFGKLKHEQVEQLVSGMSVAEKTAFRTGVARHLYSGIMEPSNDLNSAKRVINAPESRDKLRALFDSNSDFNLFEAALRREMQLYEHAGKILGGSQTHRRGQMAKALDADSAVGDVVSQTVTGGFTQSLSSLAARAMNASTMTEDVADKLAGMLVSKSPNEVAAAVKLLERYAAQAPRSAAIGSAVESGAATGAAVSVFPAPPGEQKEAPDISIDTPVEVPSGGLDIEEAIRQDEERQGQALP